jgi:hypothetical protein
MVERGDSIMKRITFFAILFLLGSSVWAWGASPESYLPLKEGIVWEYQNKFFDLKSRDQIGAAKAVKKNLAPMELQGTRVVPQVFSFYQPDNVLRQETRSFIVKDNAGFYVFARQAGQDKQPEIMPTKYYILKFPFTKGASWQQEAEGFTLQDTIEATDASVQVPAGTFKDCLLVKKLYFNPKNPNTPVQEALFWFAPEVGNVKVVIKHLQENKELVQELASFKK